MQKIIKIVVSKRIRLRGTWNGVNPVTKIIPNKKHYKRKDKHPRSD